VKQPRVDEFDREWSVEGSALLVMRMIVTSTFAASGQVNSDESITRIHYEEDQAQGKRRESAVAATTGKKVSRVQL